MKEGEGERIKEKVKEKREGERRRNRRRKKKSLLDLVLMKHVKSPVPTHKFDGLSGSSSGIPELDLLLDDEEIEEDKGIALAVVEEGVGEVRGWPFFVPEHVQALVATLHEQQNQT